MSVGVGIKSVQDLVLSDFIVDENEFLELITEHELDGSVLGA